MKSLYCLICGATAKFSECLSYSHSLNLSLPIYGEAEISGSELWNGLLNPFLVKATASSLS
jgi:hypothetical protein